MALRRTVTSALKFSKPVLISPCFLVPCTVNMQVRYAARKGYREAVNRAKKNLENTGGEVKSKELYKLKKSTIKGGKTVDLKKPEPPPDDVFIRDDFNYVKYSLSEAVKLHREYHHPTVYNNPNAVVNLRFEINMTGKTQFQFIKPFSDVATIPHPFVVSYKKEVMVLCKPEDVSLALSCGAAVAGGEEVIKKIKDGSIQPSFYEYVICHISLLSQLTPIRKILKDQLPRAKTGTLTNDIKSAIYRFLHGIEYSCVQLGAKDIGFINCTVGLINMELDQLEENFKALISSIESRKLQKSKQFITWIWCTSPPSDEEFSIDLSKYVEIKESAEDDEDDDDDDDDKSSVHQSEKILEVEARRDLKIDYEKEELLKNA